MKKIICLVLMLSLSLLGGCGAFGSKNDYLLEDVKLYCVISLEDKTSTDDYFFEFGDYEFHSNTYRYLGRFSIVARQVRYNPYPDIDFDKTRYTIKVDKDTYEKYKESETAVRFRVVI